MKDVAVDDHRGLAAYRRFYREEAGKRKYAPLSCLTLGARRQLSLGMWNDLTESEHQV